MVQIYGTLGPSCADEAVLEQMFSAGMTGIRINLSHTGLFDAAEDIARIRRSADRCNVLPRILIDMNGPEFRLGTMPAPIQVTAGEEIRLGGDALPVPSALLLHMEAGDEIAVDDGKVLLSVLRSDGETVLARVLRGGFLCSRKSIVLRTRSVYAPVLTLADQENLKVAREFGVTDIMQPFVRSAEDLKVMRHAMEENGCKNLRLLAKIENRDGVAALPELMDGADEIVIARGDLGNQYPLWEVPGLQKTISAFCREKKKPFMVVTQMLDSMTNAPSPTRAEVSDIFNAILDGAASVMVTGETAIGRYPAETIRFLRRTVSEAVQFLARQTP